MSYEFLSKHPEVAMAEVKELLYARLQERLNFRLCLDPSCDSAYRLTEEIEFLRNVLDLIERS